MGITLKITSLLDDNSDSGQKVRLLLPFGYSYGKKPNGERPVTAPSPSEPKSNDAPNCSSLPIGFLGLPRLIH